MFIGRELALHPGYSPLQRFYIRLFGAPIVGLRIRARNVFSLIPRDRRFKKILDVGTGTGVFAFHLSRTFPEAEVLGIDLSKSAVDDAILIQREARVSKVRFQVADISAFTESDLFDLALCVDILEHIEDDFAAVAGIYRALAPGGILVLHVPALYRRYPVWKKSINFDVETHVRAGYEREEILEKVTRAGFKVLDSGNTYGFLETLANNLSYMITRARKKNQNLYALAFPILNLMSWLGARARPKLLGAGIFVVCEKMEPDRAGL